MSTQLLSFHRLPILSALPQDARASLERAADEKQFRRRQIIFFAEETNDYIYLLGSGRVKLLRGAPSGREVTLGMINPNEFFGEAHLFEANIPYGCTAEVMEDAIAFAFRRTDLATALAASPDALREMMVLQGERRSYTEHRLAEYVFYDVPARLAHLLARLSQTHGRNTKEGILIRVKLTHQELANLVGSTRETTTLILNEFRRRGLLEFSGRKIVVADAEALQQLGGASQVDRKPRGARS